MRSPRWSLASTSSRNRSAIAAGERSVVQAERGWTFTGHSIECRSTPRTLRRSHRHQASSRVQRARLSPGPRGHLCHTRVHGLAVLGLDESARSSCTAVTARKPSPACAARSRDGGRRDQDVGAAPPQDPVRPRLHCRRLSTSFMDRICRAAEDGEVGGDSVTFRLRAPGRARPGDRAAPPVCLEPGARSPR